MSSIHFFKESDNNYVFESKKISFKNITLDYDLFLDIDNGLESVLIVNLTDQDVILSMDGKKDYLIVPRNSDCIIPFSDKSRCTGSDYLYVKSFYLPEHGNLFMEFIYKFEFIKVYTSCRQSKLKIDKNFFKEKRKKNIFEC